MLFLTEIKAQTAYPTANPVMKIEVEGTEQEETNYSGSAPVIAHFTSNIENQGEYTPYFEWRFYNAGKEDSPFILRYDENVDYTFQTSGTSYVKLYVTFVNGQDTVLYEMDEPLSIMVSESKLEMPNAFSPNGDGQNDIYKAKEGYQSIVSFHAYIFNRWGKKIYEWTDLEGGWNGKSGGADAKEGVYFCLVEAKGADGRNYNIKKSVTLLRGYSETNSSSSE